MRIKKNYFYGGIILFVLVAAAAVYYSPLLKPGTAKTPQDNADSIEWLVDTDGYLYYPLNRGPIEFNRANLSENGSVSVSKIIFKSRGRNIYGLLVLPKFVSEQFPGIVLLPGAGVSKESELGLAKQIAELGAAVLTLDQAGVGETGGYTPSLEEDYNSFVNAQEPAQHLIVYDALRAYDLLYSAPFIDPNRIIMAGESLGGRIAVIAVAMDTNLAGALIISSAGFDFKGGGDISKDAFLKSIDSDHYIGLISPRKLVMIHSNNDNIIPLASAVNSFSKAKGPKQFMLVNDSECRHGYCDPMWPSIVDALDYLVGIK